MVFDVGEQLVVFLLVCCHRIDDSGSQVYRGLVSEAIRKDIHTRNRRIGARGSRQERRPVQTMHMLEIVVRVFQNLAVPFEGSAGEPDFDAAVLEPDRSDDLSDEYELEDGKHSVAEAVDYVNNWFEANYGQFSPDFDYKVETIIVRKHEEGYLYQILVHALYKGVPLDSYTRAAEKPDGTNVPKMTNLDYGVSIQIVRSDEISSFTNGGCIIKPVEVEAVDKCISLDSALRFCEDKFSNFKDITISDIDIMYTLIPVYEPVPDEPDKQELVRYDSRPVWEFVIDVDPTEFIKEGEVNTRGDVRKYIYIDMITGELKYDFEVRRY